MGRSIRYKVILFIIFLLNPIFAQDNNILVKNENYIKSYEFFLKGESYFNKKKYDNAIPEYIKAIKIFEHYPENYYKLAKIYLLKHEYLQIERNLNLSFKYKDYFKDKADLIGLYKTAGEYYETVKKNEKALDQYLNLLRIQSNIYYKFKAGLLLYSLGKLDEAINYLYIFKDYIKKSNKIFDQREDYKTTLKILININTDKNNYVQAYELMKEIYLYYPEEDVLNKLVIFSNNLKNYYTNR